MFATFFGAQSDAPRYYGNDRRYWQHYQQLPD